MWRAAVVTVSDRCAAGEAEDVSGGLIADRLAVLPAAVCTRRVVADDAALIRHAAVEAFECHLAVFTGGTGLAPRDVTPQTLRPLLDYEVPGMAEAMRARGLESTPQAMLSRQLAGVAGRCLVLALPGSARAVEECLDAVWPSLRHALAVIAGHAGH
jgi:molybdenum cofactor synthesis domain-containing protein